jgi:Methyltransferase domain
MIVHRVKGVLKAAFTRAWRMITERHAMPAPATMVEIEDFYPYSYIPQRRYPDHQPHQQIEALLAADLPRYTAILKAFSPLMPDFLQISRTVNEALPGQPAWLNGFFPALDGIALYGMMANKRPQQYWEIGSGNSTKFAAAAKQKYCPGTTILSIDPVPRAEIDALCDKTIRQSLQTCDLSMFSTLKAGDILFFDGSHRVLQNSDVSIFFLEVLPQLAPGVLVHVHDIYLPVDYPDSWAKRMYSEQYMLGMLLLYAPQSIEVLLPNTFLSYRPDVVATFKALWDAPHLPGLEQHGVSFWFTKR